jgi:hypothetical protein
MNLYPYCDNYGIRSEIVVVMNLRLLRYGSLHFLIDMYWHVGETCPSIWQHIPPDCYHLALYVLKFVFQL